jgi:hypothetical protein
MSRDGTPSSPDASPGIGEEGRAEVAPPPSTDPLEPTAEDEEIAEATKTVDVKLPLLKSEAKVISRKDFSNLFHIIPDFTNRQLQKVEDPEYRELALIWVFEKDEINQIADWVYTLLEAYLPSFLVWLGGEGFYSILSMIIAVAMMFGPRIVKTYKWYKARKVKEIDAGTVAGTA